MEGRTGEDDSASKGEAFHRRLNQRGRVSKLAAGFQLCHTVTDPLSCHNKLKHKRKLITDPPTFI